MLVPSFLTFCCEDRNKLAMKKNDYFAAFILAGFTGLGCKMILSTEAGCEGEKKILNNIPIACAISGALLFAAISLLPNVEVGSDSRHEDNGEEEGE